MTGPVGVPHLPTAPRLRAVVPRLVLGGAGPIAAFYAGSELAGTVDLSSTVGGIVAATATSLLLYLWERRKGRPGILARLSLAVIVLQVTAGLIGHSASLYFLPKAIVDLIEGAAFLVSCLTRRPLIGVLARELTQVRREPTARPVFVRLTLLWGTYFTARGVICLWILLTASTHTFLLVRACIDAPLVIPLLAFSIRYGVRRLGGHPAAVKDPDAVEVQPCTA